MLKKIKWIIIFLSISVILLLMFIVLYKTKQIPNQNIEDEIYQHASEEEETDLVSNNVQFFSVGTCITQYIDLLNVNSDLYYGYDENNEYVKIIEPSESIIQLLSEKYIKENNITQENIQQKIEIFDEKCTFVPLKMRLISNNIINKYLVYGIIENIENKYIGDSFIFVNVDESNSTFSIEPITRKYDDIFDIKFENNETSIEENDWNYYEEINVDNEFLCREYINTYKKLALSNPELSYEYLDEEYRNKRFGNVDNYKLYVEKNKDEIEALQCEKYQINNYEEYTQYVCQDKYENVLIFNEKNIMDFSLKLDTYTVLTENFMETYSSADNQKKVLMNTDKWIQMLNNRDYNAAYNLLDENYRDNTFGSEEEFETMIKEKLPSHYKATYSNYEEENETYVLDVSLSDITQEEDDDNNINISVIMQLKDNYEFVMSFEIK